MSSDVQNARFGWHHVRRKVLYAMLLVCVLSFAILRWVWWPVRISGDSMTPNYDDGQPNYINKLAYFSEAPQRGDVVGLRVGPEVYIKRVIGLPGEKIEFRRDIIVVNGRPLAEPYPVKPLLWRLKPVQLGKNDYFVMGDNRPSSMLGAIHRENIIGKAVF